MSRVDTYSNFTLGVFDLSTEDSLSDMFKKTFHNLSYQFSSVSTYFLELLDLEVR